MFLWHLPKREEGFGASCPPALIEYLRDFAYGHQIRFGMRWIAPEPAVPALVPADVCDRQEDVSGECDRVWQEHDDVNLVRRYLIAIVAVHIYLQAATILQLKSGAGPHQSRRVINSSAPKTSPTVFCSIVMSKAHQAR